MPIAPSPGSAAPGAGFTAYPADIIGLAPYLYWEAQDASGNATDSSGNSRPGVVSGTAATYNTVGPGNASGATPKAIQMGDATTAFAGGTPNLQSNFFVELWVFPTTVAAAQLFTSANVGGNNFTLQTTATNTYNVVVQGVAALSNSNTVLATNTWHQIVISKQSGAAGAWSYFTDGALDLANAGTSAPGAAQTGSFQVNGAGGWRWAHASVVTGLVPTTGVVMKRYLDMVYGK